MKQLQHMLEFIRRKTDFVPEVGLVLGSGLGGFAAHVHPVCTFPFSEIPGFPVSTVTGHAGQLILGTAEGVKVAVLSGRVHYYEGYEPEQVVVPVRLLKLLGIRVLLLTNAAGGLNPAFHPGDFMLLTDHIASFVPSPLRGANPADLGPRFPDMSAAYASELRKVVQTAAGKVGLPLQTGVYLQAPGPQYETPAEIRLFRALGADAVGMSTAMETIAAVHAGLQVIAISLITNLAAGISTTPLSHLEVTAAADRAASGFQQLVAGILRELQHQQILRQS